MTTQNEHVFLLDVDNTLLDDDKIQADFHLYFDEQLGRDSRDRNEAILSELWDKLGYCDYLGALQRYRLAYVADMNNPHLLQMADFLLDYPFADVLYPMALDAVAHFGSLGRTAILTDGDGVYEPRKVQRSGLWRAVDGHVLIYVHNEKMLEDVAQRYPARHHMLVDDKLRILSALKAIWGERLTTVFPRQGHFALDAEIIASHASANMTVEHIADLMHEDFPMLVTNLAPI